MGYMVGRSFAARGGPTRHRRSRTPLGRVRDAASGARAHASPRTHGKRSFFGRTEPGRTRRRRETCADPPSFAVRDGPPLGGTVSCRVASLACPELVAEKDAYTRKKAEERAEARGPQIDF
jgi:hypothetical protein